MSSPLSRDLPQSQGRRPRPRLDIVTGGTAPDLTRASHRLHLWVAIALWTSLTLGVSLSRSLPGIGGSLEIVARALGIAAAGWVILAPPQASDPGSKAATKSLLLGFAVVPAVGAALALFRGEPGDTLNHLASGLALVAASRLDVEILAESARRALLYLIGASLVIGVAYPVTVDPNDRAFMRILYDGRLRGLLGSANSVGLCAVLLIVFSLIAARGRTRWVGIGIAIVAILAASSQTALMAAAVVLLVAGALVMRRSGGGILVCFSGVTALATALVALFVWVNQPRPRHADALLGKVTLSARVDIWELVLRQDVPFTGLGQSRIEELFDTNRIQGATGVSSVHNVVLDGYARDGWFGLAALAVMAFVLMAVVVRHRADLALIPIVAFLVEGMTETSPSHVPFFALTFAAVVVALEQSPTDILRVKREHDPALSA